LQDDNSETAEACEISAMPTFKFYKNGKEIDSFQGASVEKLLSTVATLSK
jgi:thioredoxin-like negative regulator of GroEL